MNKRSLVIVPSVILLVAAFAGCESAELTAVPSPSPTVAPSANPTNTPDNAPSDVPTPTVTAIPIGPPTLESAPASEYEVFCSELPLLNDLDQRFGGNSFTYAQAVEDLSEVITTWEASDPPAEVAAWHNEMLTAWQSLEVEFDAQPPGEILGADDEVLNLATIRLLVNIAQAEALLSRETRNAMVSAGCLGDDATPDNHGDEQSSATTIALGDEIEGSLNYLGDTDYFVFAAEAGTSYRVDLPGSFIWALLLSVLLGTEEVDLYRPSWIVLYDSTGTELLRTDLALFANLSRQDFESIITWDATADEDYYISLGDWELGDYTLMVDEAGGSSGTVGPTPGPTSTPDDHGDDIDSSTIVSIGTSLEAVLNYWGDVDYFRFTAQAGQLYQVDVALGTLHGSELISLLDSHDVVLASNYDYGATYASRIVWSAPASGDYFIRVSSRWGEGSYTLTVTETVS